MARVRYGESRVGEIENSEKRRYHNVSQRQLESSGVKCRGVLLQMKKALLFLGVLLFLITGCTGTTKVQLDTLNLGEYENNWDTLTILRVDGRKLGESREKVMLSPGERTIVFHVSYMRGFLDKPIEVVVPVTAAFASDKSYRAHCSYETGLMGVLIEEQRDTLEGGKLIAGAYVYSAEFLASKEKMQESMLRQR